MRNDGAVHGTVTVISSAADNNPVDAWKGAIVRLAIGEDTKFAIGFLGYGRGKMSMVGRIGSLVVPCGARRIRFQSPGSDLVDWKC